MVDEDVSHVLAALVGDCQMQHIFWLHVLILSNVDVDVAVVLLDSLAQYDAVSGHFGFQGAAFGIVGNDNENLFSFP